MYEAIYKALYELRPLIVADFAKQGHNTNMVSSDQPKLALQHNSFDGIAEEESSIIKENVYIFFVRMFALKHIAVKAYGCFRETPDKQMPCGEGELREHFKRLSNDILLFSEGYSKYIFPSKELLNKVNHLLDGWNSEAYEDDFLATFYEAYNHLDNEDRRQEVFDGSYTMSSITSVYTPLWLCRLLVKNAMQGLKSELFQNPGAPGKSILESFRVLDPSCGCGNFLLATFDTLHEFYLSLGYGQKEIPALILQNIHGFDIEDKAVQLARLGLFLKAKQGVTDRECDCMNIFSAAISIDKEAAATAFRNAGLSITTAHFDDILTQFDHASTLGTLIQLKGEDVEAARIIASNARNTTNPIISVCIENMKGLVELLCTSYDLVLCNPPYALPFHYDAHLKQYIDRFYRNGTDFSGNLYSCFIKRAGMMVKDNGIIVMVHPAPLFYAKKFATVRTFLHQYFNFEWLLSSSSTTVFQGHIPEFEIVMYAIRKAVARNTMYFLRIRASKRNDARELTHHFLSMGTTRNIRQIQRKNTKRIMFYLRHPNLYDRVLIYFH